MSLANFSIGWFDFAIAIMVLVGVKLGSNRGMSKEFLTFLQWGLLVVGAGLFYPVVGGILAHFTGLGATPANVLGYLLVAGVVKLFFIFLNNRLGEKIEDKHMFGSLEYYLGPVAGGIRFACIVLLLTALLHVATQTTAQRQQAVKYQKDNYGSVYFPTLGLINDDVFNNSVAGRWIGQNLSFLLIAPGNPATTPAKNARS
jgi:uncharacterized membrane protein required for colicin V production